uniref:Leucine rich repeat containing protein 9 n=1 Tax=Echinococcus granulosus TaxID=6210 RepID=A0A068WBE0_ECHGR|nr:leucine rich repeat containing protein 9 [Echinococcus granulosus]
MKIKLRLQKPRQSTVSQISSGSLATSPKAIFKRFHWEKVFLNCTSKCSPEYKMDSFSDDVIKEIRRLNNIPENEENPDDLVEKLHLFFTSLPSNKLLRTFDNLKELVIVGQKVPNLLFIKDCTKLTKLWICESGLESMKGLNCATRLEELCLYDNRLKVIEELEGMNSLCRLWLNNNDISFLTGLQNLQGLCDLNVAGNQISRLDASLIPCTKLESINLSGNNFYDLPDVLSLALLPKLRLLRINDAEFTPNPISSLPYTSLALVYHIPQLCSIDGMDLREPFVSFLQSLIREKKLFYFAKSRHRHNFLLRTQRTLLILKKRLSIPIIERLRLLDLQIRLLEAYVNRLINLRESTSKEIKALHQSLGKIRVRSCWWKNKLSILEAEYEYYTSALSVKFKINQCLHTAELQMFGCLTISQIDRSAELFNLCRRFCQMRMCWHDRCLEGFSELRLNNLWHIRNDLLNNYCQKNQTNGNFKEELLFYNCLFSSDIDFCHLGEFLRSGFPSDGIVGSFSFTTLLSRLLKLDSFPIEKAFNSSFVILVVRALTKEGSNCVRTGIILSPKNATFTNGKKSFCACAIAHFEYAFSETACLIPEFLAELELISTSSLSQMSAFMNRDSSRASTITDSIESLSSHGINRDSEVLKAKPDIPSPPDLSEKDVKNALRNPWFGSISGQTLEAITELNFHGTGFQSFRGLQELPILRTLILSNCGITSLKELSLPFLETLDISHNALHSLKSLGSCPSLLTLDANWNLLSNLEVEVRHLLWVAGNLATLRLEYNPWFRDERVSERAQSLLSSLSPTSKVCFENQSYDVEVFRRTHIFTTSRNYMLTLWPVLGMLLRKLSGQVPNLDFFMQSTRLSTHPFTFSKTTLGSLTALTLNNVNLMELGSLCFLDHLQELSVEGNSLTSLNDLQHFPKLRTLLAANNLISSIANCSFNNMTNLQVLALDNNEIVNLTPLTDCLSLKQLFISSNRITNYQSVLALSDLPDLRVVDLRFNPLKTQLSRYRLRTVYHLPHLAFLDGVEVNISEVNEAREALDGRLSTDYLLASLGLESPGRVTHYNCEDGGIRSVELAPSEAFFNLHTLNLQNNRLTSFEGLLQLENLEVLWLPGNKISTLCSGISGRDTKVTYLPKLAVLSLAQNDITSLVPLHLNRFPALRTLFLQDNAISTLSGLVEMDNLRHLVLDRNKFRKLLAAEFIGLSRLVELHLEGNRLREIPSMEHLEELCHLYLGENKLEHLVNTLESFAPLKSLTHLGLHKNPLSKSPSYRLLVCHHLPQLQCLDAIDVTPRESQTAANLFAYTEEQLPINAAFESEQILLSPVVREKQLSKPIWRSMANVRFNLPSVTKLPENLPPGMTSKQAGDGTASTMSLLIPSATALFPSAFNKNLPQRRRTVEPNNVSRATAMRNNCKRIVMSIPGVSINAMAHFDSHTPDGPNTERADESAAVGL